MPPPLRSGHQLDRGLDQIAQSGHKLRRDSAIDSAMIETGGSRHDRGQSDLSPTSQGWRTPAAAPKISA
jgi:hypothetical protein